MTRSLIASLGILLIVSVVSGCASSGGRADREEILALSEQFFDAMERRDVELASRTLVPEGVFVSVRDADGARSVRSFSNSEWMSRLADRRSEVREWFTDRPFVMIEGDVAMLWGEYAFEIEGEHSHTGIDIITFVRTDAGWRIAGGAYSVVGQRQ